MFSFCLLPSRPRKIVRLLPKSFLVFSLVTTFAISATQALAVLTSIARICEPALGSTVDEKVPPPIFFNRFPGDSRLMRFEGRADKDNRLVGVKRVAVSDEEVKGLCEQGFPVAALNIGSAKAANRSKTIVEPLSALKTAFTIKSTNFYGYLPWKIYGNFWVPGSMPTGHTYQVVDFTVTPNNYENSGPYSHFAVGTLVVSDSNFDHDSDGKRAAIFGGSGNCGSANKTALQSWAIQNHPHSHPPSSSCGSYLGCSNPVFDGVIASPSTCRAWDAIVPKRFWVGANTWQGSVHWRCQPGGTCPEFTSPSIDSTTPYFRSGGAGVMFVHVLSADVEWALSFSNALSYSAP